METHEHSQVMWLVVGFCLNVLMLPTVPWLVHKLAKMHLWGALDKCSIEAIMSPITTAIGLQIFCELMVGGVTLD